MEDRETEFLKLIKNHSILINKNGFLSQNEYYIVDQAGRNLINYQPLCSQVHIHYAFLGYFDFKFFMNDTNTRKFMKKMLFKYLNIKGDRIYTMYLVD